MVIYDPPESHLENIRRRNGQQLTPEELIVKHQLEEEARQSSMEKSEETRKRREKDQLCAQIRAEIGPALRRIEAKEWRGGKNIVHKTERTTKILWHTRQTWDEVTFAAFPLAGRSNFDNSRCSASDDPVYYFYLTKHGDIYEETHYSSSHTFTVKGGVRPLETLESHKLTRIFEALRNIP